LNALNYLYLALDEKINSQIFYNELSVKVTNPVARAIFTRLRDEEMAHIEVLQQEITAIEVRPFPINIIVHRLKA
jgi:rubrerythrin